MKKQLALTLSLAILLLTGCGQSAKEHGQAQSKEQQKDQATALRNVMGEKLEPVGKQRAPGAPNAAGM